MCRFRTPAQQKKTIEDTKRGLVDIVVGTHRVLSKDLEFKDLGLLIIDEEQRFGVQHKEQIKKLKENIDVLTLTATPIPRTLHMSLIGIRDMSVLEEAPVDRMPIQTYVMEYNDEMVREAIQRELSRQGQVYYVYNKVKDIDEITDKVQKLVPEANVAFAHGQMKERELENIMLDFINGEIDVLVSTTIIETGLDISNANTMIIHDADQLGLSQIEWHMRFCYTKEINSCVKWQRNACQQSVSSQILVLVLKSPCGIWKSAEQGIFWGQNSTDIWRLSGMTCIVRCSMRRLNS